MNDGARGGLVLASAENECNYCIHDDVEPKEGGRQGGNLKKREKNRERRQILLCYNVGHDYR